VIEIDPRAREGQAQRVTVLMHKPVGYVSGQAEDGHEPASVLFLPENQWMGDTSGQRFNRNHLRGLAPAGRLDIDSHGLLVLTQDGRVAKHADRRRLHDRKGIPGARARREVIRQRTAVGRIPGGIDGTAQSTDWNWMASRSSPPR
jgi:hypothetical protein